MVVLLRVFTSPSIAAPPVLVFWDLRCAKTSLMKHMHRSNAGQQRFDGGRPLWLPSRRRRRVDLWPRGRNHRDRTDRPGMVERGRQGENWTLSSKLRRDSNVIISRSICRCYSLIIFAICRFSPPPSRFNQWEVSFSFRSIVGRRGRGMALI